MSQENLVCPLCMEDLDIDDLTFIPCTCGYQICRFCWHRIRTAESGTCPACRKPYTEGPAQFKPLSTNEINQLKKKKKLKESEEKRKNTEKSLQFFASARVIQKNLMFVVGLPANITEFELRKQENFGKFGKISKVTLTKMLPPSNNNNNTSISQHSNSQSQSAYVMFARIEDTLQAIKALNSSQHQFGKSIKASLGTTKYCSRFTKGQQCLKSECMYLHEAVDEEACFTKEEIQQGKHIAYEQKLFSIYCKQDDICLRTPSPPTANQDNHLLPGRVEKVTTGTENKQNGKGRESPKQSKTIKPATTESTTQSNPSKPATVVQTHCWTVSGATIVKSNLKPQNATGQTTTSITRNGLLINSGAVNLQKLGNKDSIKSNGNKTKELRRSEVVTAPSESTRTSISSNDNNNNGMTSELPEVGDDASSRASTDEDFSNPPSEDGAEGKILEKVTVPSLVDSEEAPRSPSCEEELQGDDEEEDVSSMNDSNGASNERIAELELEIGLRQSPNLDESITKSEHFLANEDFDSPLGRSPAECFFDGIASTPQTKGALPPSNLLDLSDIEVEVADLKVEDTTNSLDCSKDDDRHDDDIDPWKIVSLQLDMINNERILEEGPLYCQTSTSFLQADAERSMLGSCGFQENRSSHFQQFFNNCNDQPLLSSSDMAMTNNRSFRQQDMLEEVDRQRQQQRMQLMMQHHHQQQQFMNGVRSQTFPPADSKTVNSFYPDPPNCVPYLGMQDQQRPVPVQDQYSNAHVHQQIQQQQMHRQHYLYMQKLQQQQLERLHSQFMPPSAAFNGQFLANNNALLPGNNQVMARQQQQLKQLHEQQNMSQVLPNELKRWQDGLKAMLPNVNISFGPSPPFIKENQNPPTKQPASTNGDVFLDTSMRNGEISNGSMHEVACLDPAIVNAGAVANYPVPSSYNTSLMIQQQQQQQQHMGFNYSMSNYQRSQQQESIVHRSFDWQGQTNGISDAPQHAPQHVPLFARGVPGVPPPPGFEKLHPSRKDHM